MGRKTSIAALRDIQEEHCRWVSTGGSEGRCANLSEVKLNGLKLHNINLNHADLSGARGLTIEQLSEAKTLYKARLDPDLMKQVKEEYPNLLEEPKSAE